jgi:glutathione S-transferase
MLKLYEYASSGNCYKIRLLLNQLGIAYQRVPIDILAGESRTPEFLARNPVGKIPVLEIQPGQYLTESMEEHLAKHDYFVGNRYTIADIALYAYTHVAEEGNFDLSRFSAILAWFDRIVDRPNYITISAVD